jgi:hypothetical protein
MRYFKLILLILFLVCYYIPAQDFSKIEGWQIGSDILKYNPENLWEYINGGADQFIDYGFESLKATEFSQNTLMVTVDIYDMKLPLNAFGIYRAQKPEGVKILNIGTESLISLPAQCLLLKDRYYVKIHVLKGELTEKIGIDLLEAVSKALPGEAKFPDEFTLLPSSGLKKSSLGHVRTNFLGLSELSNCIFATYSEDNTEFQYFAVIPDSNNSAETIWNTIKDKWKYTQLDGKDICYRNIPYKGYVGIIKKDKYLLGVADVSDEKILKDRIKNL